jgi:transcriptional regulator with XRE-family HTH domain
MHGRRSLADRLNLLFATFKPADGVNRARSDGEYFNSEIAERINKGPLAERMRREMDAPVTISGAYIGELRSGKATDPRLSHLKALAMAFGVPTAYLIADGDGPEVHDIEGDLQRLRTMRELNVRKVVLRDVLGRTGLSPASQQALDSVLRQLLELEGIGADPEPPT